MPTTSPLRLLLFMLLPAATLSYVACNKIGDSLYTLEAGAAGVWYEGVSVENHSQQVFLEKYTGPRCAFCPTADDIIRQACGTYASQLNVVTIHDSSSFGTPLGEVDLRTPTGNAWRHAFSIDKHPLALLNRSQANGHWRTIDPTAALEDAIATELLSQPTIALSMQATVQSDSLLALTVFIEALHNIEQPLTLTLLLTEDSIVAPQMMPDGTRNNQYVHNHVLRAAITDLWGAPIEVPLQVASCLAGHFTYRLSNPSWRLTQCHAVAFVSYADSRCILNSTTCALTLASLSSTS